MIGSILTSGMLLLSSQATVTPRYSAPDDVLLAVDLLKTGDFDDERLSLELQIDLMSEQRLNHIENLLPDCAISYSEIQYIGFVSGLDAYEVPGRKGTANTWLIRRKPTNFFNFFNNSADKVNIEKIRILHGSGENAVTCPTN